MSFLHPSDTKEGFFPFRKTPRPERNGNMSFLHQKCIPKGCFHFGVLRKTKCELFTRKMHSRRLFAPRRSERNKMWAFYTIIAFQKAVFTSETRNNQNVSFLHEKCIPESCFHFTYYTFKALLNGYPHPKYYQNECDFWGYQKDFD